MLNHRKAKIICTIGPTCESEEMLTRLVKAGMDVARLNFSHGTHEEHLEKIRRIRHVSQKMDKSVAILQDLQGPKIRIGKFADPPVNLKVGDVFKITIDDVEGTEECVSTTYKSLPKDINPGDSILVNDGLIKLQVTEKTERDVTCIVMNGGYLYDRRGINLPGVRISEPSLTEKDISDLEFGLEHGIDFVALSFVRDADSIHEIKKRIGKRDVPVVAKLEKPEALENLDAIIEATDAVMVARGDLGVEISSEKVPVVQKMIIEKCQAAGKPVITATQMLDSMMDNPIPTRAEASDVANAIFDGSDAVMLSGETAFGKFPVESVQTMNAIILEAEKRQSFFRLDPDKRFQNTTKSFSGAVCHAAYHSALETEASCIVVFTKSGFTAKKMSNFRPCVPILALTDNKRTLYRTALNWGVVPLLLEETIQLTHELTDLESFLKKKGWADEGDNLVILAGSVNEEGGTNLLRLHRI